MNPTLLPDKILTKLSPEDRQSLGRFGMTASEAQAKYATGVERSEQKIFSMWLSQRGLYFIRRGLIGAARFGLAIRISAFSETVALYFLR
jgi:hypothetical protein